MSLLVDLLDSALNYLNVKYSIAFILLFILAQWYYNTVLRRHLYLRKIPGPPTRFITGNYGIIAGNLFTKNSTETYICKCDIIELAQN